MVVQVEQIRDGGLKLTEPLAQPFLAQVLADAARDDFRCPSEATLHASLLRTLGGVLLEGSIDLPVSAPCKRCATEVVLTVPVRFTLNLVPAESKRERAT